MDIESFSGRRVLITGGLGFIGSALARRLVENGARVTIIDSLVPEYGGNPFNIADIEDKVRVNISDVRDPYSFRYHLAGQEFLFNLAGQTSHMDSMTDPFTDLDINSRAQLSILEACRHSNPGIKIVFASTRQIYGRPGRLPVDERHAMRPVDVNGVNKMAGECFHIVYNDVYGIRSSVLRLTNTIGPRMRIKDARQTFVGVWVNNVLRQQPIDVWGGDQIRDFTFVDDAVDAFLAAAASDAADGQIFNLGGPEPVSLRHLAEMLIEIQGSGSICFKDFPSDRKSIDIGDFYSDCSKIQDVLGWFPRTSIRASLEATVSFYRANLEHYL